MEPKEYLEKLSFIIASHVDAMKMSCANQVAITEGHTPPYPDDAFDIIIKDLMTEKEDGFCGVDPRVPAPVSDGTLHPNFSSAIPPPPPPPVDQFGRKHVGDWEATESKGGQNASPAIPPPPPPVGQGGREHVGENGHGKCLDCGWDENQCTVARDSATCKINKIPPLMRQQTLDKHPLSGHTGTPVLMVTITGNDESWKRSSFVQKVLFASKEVGLSIVIRDFDGDEFKHEM